VVPTVDDIVDLVLSRKPTCGSTRVVAVDGPAGSGKTTVGGAIGDELTARGHAVVLVHMDDLYDGWTALDGSHAEGLAERVEQQLLAPLARHESARWQRFDWYADRFDGWESFDPPAALVVEGCGSGARDYDAYNTVLVWVETDRDERIRRGVARDGEQVLDHWLAWMDSEQAHFALHGTRERADLRLTTSD
jgi:uridine kinase